MADNIETPISNTKISVIRDPKLVKNRIFVGNLPLCTREELESICKPYGNVLASLVQKNFGFVQFQSEEVATNVANALTKSTFKGHIITVRNAGSKQLPIKPVQNFSKYIENNLSLSTSNHCEIIVVDRKNTEYAESIEDRLNRKNLRVDVLFPNADVPLGKVLANVSSRGCLYAILITNQHEEHNSITVNILHGKPTEHRNMPVDDAINLIIQDFQNMVKELSQRLPRSNFLSPSRLKYTHPEPIQVLIDMLHKNKTLTVLQYDSIIHYLKEIRDLQIQAELGVLLPSHKTPDPEIQLQKKLLNILSKPSTIEQENNNFYENMASVKKDVDLMKLLRDIRVRKALDSLLESNCLNIIQKEMKFEVKDKLEFQ